MARAKKGEIREVVRDLKQSVAELLDAVTADGGKAVVLALQKAEEDLEEIRDLCEDRYADAFDEIEGPIVPEPGTGEAGEPGAADVEEEEEEEEEPE